MAGVLFVLRSDTMCHRRRLLCHQDLAAGVVVWGVVCARGALAVAETRALPLLLQ